MSDLDIMIYALAGAGLIISFFRWQALPAAILLCLSFAFNECIFIPTRPSYAQLSQWLFLFALKDYLTALILGFRRKTTEFLLSMIFMVSCLFHLLAQIEVYNHILHLKHMRTEFMAYITAAQLATMYLIILNGSGNNGGKRVKHYLPDSNRHYGRFFHTKAFKVKQ